jgi:hypothetical protein
VGAVSESRFVEMRRRSRLARERSVSLARDARRRLAAPPRGDASKQRGRLWLNGRELGTPDRRFAHLSGSYD